MKISMYPHALYLYLLATSDEDHRQLCGVHFIDGKAIASDGHVLGAVEVTKEWSGFIPSKACKAVLTGAKKDHTFYVETESDEMAKLKDTYGGSKAFYLCRSDGVAFKVLSDDQPEPPGFAAVIDKKPTHELDCPIGINLAYLTRLDGYLKKIRPNRNDVPLQSSFSFSEKLSQIKVECGPLKAIVMPCRVA